MSFSSLLARVFLALNNASLSVDHSVSIPSGEGCLGCFSGDGFDCYPLGRSQGASSKTPPQDTPTAKNYPTQNVSSTEVEKRCSKYILNPLRQGILITRCFAVLEHGLRTSALQQSH